VVWNSFYSQTGLIRLLKSLEYSARLEVVFFILFHFFLLVLSSQGEDRLIICTSSLGEVWYSWPGHLFFLRYRQYY